MTLGIGLAALFVAGWLPVFLLRTEILRDALPMYSRGERFWVLASIVILTGHISATCVITSLTPRIPPSRALLCALLFAAGIAFWFWARVTIAPLPARRQPDDPPLALRRDGPFAIVRNPLYFGTLVAAGASTFAAGRRELAFSLVCCVIALSVRAIQEERRLHSQLGGVYEEYCRHVRRLIPFLW